MFNRSRRKLAHWFMLSMGGILIAFAGIRYALSTVKRMENTDQLLYKKAQVVAASVRYEFRNGRDSVDLKNVPYLGNLPLPADSEAVYVRWYDRQGQLRQFFGIGSTSQLGDVPEFQTLSISAGVLEPQPVLVRQVTLPVQYRGRLIGYLQIATPLTQVRSELQQALLVTVISTLVTLVMIAVAAWALGGIVMQPIRESYGYLQRFTADASHELRTPLAAILSNAQVGLLAPLEAGERKHQRLEKIAEITKSMTALISNLLLLARHSGRLNADALQPVNLNQLLAALIHEPSIQTAAQQVQLNWKSSEHPVTVQADPELLKQAIANLILNACKYTPVGGVIEVNLSVHSRQAVIRVEDSGIGISAADLPHIFERFYRVSSSRSKATGGSGLGLAIAQQIIEAHGGMITVQSKIGEGSIFQIALPLE